METLPRLRAGEGPVLLYAFVLLACGGSIGQSGAGGYGAGAGADGLSPGDRDAPGATGATDRSGLDGAGNARSVGFVCDASTALENERFRRLTERQYLNTLSDLLTAALADPDEAQAVLDGLAPVLAAYPRDERFKSARDLHGSYRRLDQAVGQGHAEIWYRAAVSAGTLLTEPRRLTRLAGGCAADGEPSNDSACLDDFIAAFGARVLRRPLDAQERELYRGFYGATAGEDPAGYADVIAGLLNAPQFLYIIEHGQDEPDAKLPPETYELTAYELASRLSYHFWDSMPDQELLNAAESGALLEDATYARQVQRLFDDPRTRETVREFHRDWLKLEDLPKLDKNNAFPVFSTFAGDNLPGPNLRERMINEALDMLDWHVWQRGSDLAALLTSDRAFARSEDLAAIYGLPMWDGEEPPTFTAGDRPGLLTRAAFLATGSANTRPIMKGVFIRRNILCDPIPPPPDNAAANAPQLSEDLSTREVVEELTEQPGSVCSSCHSPNINPLGFATEGFDALGRAREEQMLLTEAGDVAGMAKLDTSSVPRVFPDDETRSEGPADLMRLIADSGKAEACLARHYFRFSFGRFEDEAIDGCVLEGLRTAITEGGSLQEMLRGVALTPEFRSRSFAISSQGTP